MYTTFSFALAVIPALFFVRYYYKQDNLKKEPKGLIVNVFLLGIISTIPVVIIEIIFGEFNKLLQAESLEFFAFKAFIVAGFSEEFIKFLIIRFYIFKKTDFDEVMDGIVYAVVAGLGFACLENIIYVINGGILTAVVRAFTAIPLHALAAGIMGYYIGEARFASSIKARNNFFIQGLLWAIMIHGLYDFFLFISPLVGFWISLMTLPLLYVAYKILKRRIKRAKQKDLVMQRV
ncbi:MAG: PrsW family intramembrane metalloprotease [Calditrichaceae bacterium]|nr:PrsW family intramembrane metalloprotease [Calditrichaceae bacterium]